MTTTHFARVSLLKPPSHHHQQQQQQQMQGVFTSSTGGVGMGETPGSNAMWKRTVLVNPLKGVDLSGDFGDECVIANGHPMSPLPMFNVSACLPPPLCAVR